jgi:hypothetical protein
MMSDSKVVKWLFENHPKWWKTEPLPQRIIRIIFILCCVGLTIYLACNYPS